LRDWINTFQDVDRDRVAKAMEDYATVLRSLPSDLAWEAVQRLKATYRFPSLPKPGDLGKLVVDDHLQRRAQRNKIESAVLSGQERRAGAAPKRRRPRSEWTDEECAAHDAMMVEARRKMAEGEAKLLGDSLTHVLSPDQMAKIEAGRELARERFDAEGHEANKRRLGIPEPVENPVDDEREVANG